MPHLAIGLISEGERERKTDRQTDRQRQKDISLADLDNCYKLFSKSFRVTERERERERAVRDIEKDHRS